MKVSIGVSFVALAVVFGGAAARSESGLQWAPLERMPQIPPPSRLAMQPATCCKRRYAGEFPDTHLQRIHCQHGWCHR